MNTLKINKQCLWFVIYIALLAMSFGFVLANMETVFHIPALALFMVGVALTPSILGFWTLFLSVVYPAWKPWLLIGGGGGIAGASVSAALCSDMFPLFRMSFSIEDIFVLCPLFITFGTACGLFWTYAKSYNVHHDSNAYLSMADCLTETRDVRSLCNLTTAFPHFACEPHGIAYQAYLAFAQNFMSYGTIKEKHCILNVAQQYNNLFYFLITFGTAFGISNSLWVAATAAMLTFVPHGFHYASFAFSRDAYRLSLALCLLLFLSHVPVFVDVHNIVYYAIALFVLCYLTGDAHILNIIILVCFCIGFFIALCYPGSSFFPLSMSFVLFSCCTLSLLFVMRKYIYVYIKTGRIFGNMWRRSAFIGTRHEEHMASVFVRSLPQGTSGIRKSILYVFKNDLILFSLGCIGSLSLCILALFQNMNFGIRFVAVTSMVSLLPFTGLFDVGPYRVSKFFIANIRYPLQFYPVLVIGSVSAVNFFLSIQPYNAAQPVVSSLVVSLSFYAAVKTFSRWRFAFDSFEKKFNTYLKLFQALEEKAPWDGAIAVSNTGFPLPFLTYKATYLFSEKSFILLRADTPDVAEMLIKKRKIVFFALSVPDVQRMHLHKIPLYRALIKFHTKIYSDNEYEIWM